MLRQAQDERGRAGHYLHQHERLDYLFTWFAGTMPGVFSGIV
jgi:hypothetical protein